MHTLQSTDVVFITPQGHYQRYALKSHCMHTVSGIVMVYQNIKPTTACALADIHIFFIFKHKSRHFFLSYKISPSNQ